jgi:hypothetical protein
MADQWYCWIAGVQAGPFSGAQLKALATEGRLSPGDPVRLGPSGNWVPARQVKGLFVPPAPSAEAPGPAHTADEPGSRSRRPILRAKPVEGFAGTVAAIGPSPPAGSPPPPLPHVGSQPAPPRSAEAAASAPVEGLGFLEEEYAAPPPTIALGQGPRSDPFARMRNPKVLLWVLIGLLGLLAALIVVLFIINREAPQLRESRAADEAEKRAAREATEEKKAPADETAAKKAKSAKGAPSEPIRWVDASKDAWVGGNVTVRVLAAEIGRPKVFEGSGAAAVPKEPVLAVRLQLINRAASAKVKYAGWASPSSAVKLTDASGKECLMKTFPGDALVEGQQKATSIDPQAAIQDVLVFESPPEGVTSLRLVLPGGAIDDPQSAHFEIPKAMITILPSAKTTAPKLSPAKAAAGPAGAGKRPPRNGLDGGPTGSPFKDFGIKGAEEPEPDAKPSADKP